MTETQKAWLAGIIDGEGSIQVSRTKNKDNTSGFAYRLHVCVKMTCSKTIEYIHNIAGKGTITWKKRPFPRKRIAQWNTWSNEACIILKEILPYLVTKRDNANNAINFQEHKASRKGHFLTEEQKSLELLYHIKSKSLNGAKS